jgi:hypothetical protein
MPTGCEFVLDHFFSLRLYALHSRGFTVEQLAAQYKTSVPVISERIEAARLSIEKQVRIEAHEHRDRNSNLLSASSL